MAAGGSGGGAPPPPAAPCIDGLDVSRAGLTDIAPWLDAPALAGVRTLDASRNALRAAAGIAAALPRLRALSLYYNRVAAVRDLAPLAGAKKLASLDVRLNPVCRVADYRA